MIIAFSTKWLREVCESQSKAERELGLSVAKKLRTRLSELRAATNLSDIITGRPREFVADGICRIRLCLQKGAHLEFCSNHNSTPFQPNGKLNRESVTRVKILSVEVTHG